MSIYVLPAFAPVHVIEIYKIYVGHTNLPEREQLNWKQEMGTSRDQKPSFRK